MKLICTQENFKKAIFSTERVIGKQITLPILENILLETEKGMLKISATNLEIGVFIKIGAKIEEDGKITIPARIISNFINNLPTKETVLLETKDQNLIITSDEYRASIKGLSAQDFPIIPNIESDFIFILSAQEIKNIIPKIFNSVSLDSTRPEIAGVNMNFSQKNITLATTDSFRLSEIVVPINQKENYNLFIKKNPSLIVPINTFSEVVRLIAPETKEVKVGIEENQIFFQIDNIRVVSRLINGKYPEYRQIIPQKFETTLIADKEELLRAVKIASFFTNIKSGEIILESVSKNKLKIYSQSEDKGENKTEIEVDYSGPEQKIIFNPRYILDGINSINTPRLALLMNNGETPAVLKTFDEKKNEMFENFTYVIMPIKK